MRRLLLLISLSCCSVVFAQPYLLMLEEDHVWNTDFFVDPFGGGQTGIISSENYVAGETIINNQAYKSVYIDGVQGSCLVREENGVVYRYDIDTAQEYIIYDFTLTVGETFTIPLIMFDSFCGSLDFYNGFMDEITVTDRTTEFIANQNRVVISFDYVSELGIECKWIEGIGSNLGFDPVGDVIDIGSRYLVCFTENGITYFFNDATACDNTTLSVPDHLEDQIILAPNPIRNKSILQLPRSAEVNSVRILDLSGRLVKDFIVSRDYLVLDAMQFGSGLYFYQVISDNSVIKTEKFVIR